MSIYVVEVQTMAKRMPETVIVVEDEDGKFEVVATSLDTNKSVYDIDYNKKVIVIRK